MPSLFDPIPRNATKVQLLQWLADAREMAMAKQQESLKNADAVFTTRAEMLTDKQHYQERHKQLEEMNAKLVKERDHLRYQNHELELENKAAHTWLDQAGVSTEPGGHMDRTTRMDRRLRDLDNVFAGKDHKVKNIRDHWRYARSSLEGLAVVLSQAAILRRFIDGMDSAIEGRPPVGTAMGVAYDLDSARCL